MSDAADAGLERLLALPTEGRLMEKPELMARLGISQRTLEEIQAEGHLPAIRLRGKFGVGYESRLNETGA